MNNPNIILILTDDQGYWSLGCNGNSEIRTPNIDKLAYGGARFTNFFCTSPVCSPARSSILTGRIPSQHGVLDWIRIGNGDSESDRTSIEYLAEYPGYTDYLNEAGYICAQCGKWHMGATSKPQKGYSHWFTTIGGSGTYNDAFVYDNGELKKTNGYLTDVIVNDAINFITDIHENNPDTPFYVNLAFTAPHSPHVDQHKKEYVDFYYKNCTFSDVRQDPRSPWSLKYPVDIQYSAKFADSSREYISLRDLLSGYYAAIQGVDDAVGKLVDILEDYGIRNNTLIIFMSDNGFACGQHGIWGKGNATNPLNLFDTTIKVPCIFNWPAVIRSGIVNDSLVSAYDFMPTLLDLVGIKKDLSYLPGKSFAKTLISDSKEMYHENIHVFDEYGQQRMIRTKEWKLIHRTSDYPDELYDLRHDPDEMFNLLEENRFFLYGPEFIENQKQNLLAEMESFYEKYATPINDGKNKPVSGRGQLAKLRYNGTDEFYPWVSVEYKR